jgi:tetratricopeptide (TPR) repeat protein
LILYSLFTYSQDSIPAAVGVNENDNIKFQELFFKALSQKAVFNYKKAVEYLENCNQLMPNNKSVLFELSKNYLKLGRSIEALEYIQLALDKETNNLWLLEHKVSILKGIANFDEAITTQEKIAENHPKKKQSLVFLHLQNRDIVGAKKVLAELKEAKLLNSRLRRIQEKLNNTQSETKKPKKNVVNTDLRSVFEKEKTYSSLKLLLKELTVNNDDDLLKYSEQGLALFPAQPFVYLMNGKALNNKSQYKKALQSLQNGIDFVIDNNEIEAKFYLEMAEAYKKLNDTKKAESFKNKAAKILK